MRPRKAKGKSGGSRQGSAATDDGLRVADASEDPGTPPSASDNPLPGPERPGDSSGQEQGGERTSKMSRAKPWAGGRLVALIAVVAVVFLVAGAVAMRFIVSPAELAARTEAPEPGPVTALVEEQVIENVITTRGEVTYADPVQVTIDTAFVEGRPIVTGHVPEVGAILDPASVALEITGRPVIVLPGELPSYRSLSIGMRGPDVYQLKSALAALGYWAGDPQSDLFEWDTAAAVGQLYERVGYTPATGGPEAEDNLRMAQGNLRAAQTSLTRAYAQWNEANATEGADMSIANAEVNDAEAARDEASRAVDDAQVAVQPTLPSGEVLFLASLPRRVDDVLVKRGEELTGAAMTVSGATLTILGSVSSQDADLIKPGMEAYYAAPNGEELSAKVASVEAPKSGGSKEEGAEGTSSDRYRLTLDPGDLSEELIGELRGANVRVTIPVASTEGTVLAVPLAALSAAADGGNRVELLVPTSSDPFATELVKVSPGLAAGGLVEISSDDARLTPGAKVVVGR